MRSVENQKTLPDLEVGECCLSQLLTNSVYYRLVAVDGAHDHCHGL
jgi:hypothetical protein